MQRPFNREEQNLEDTRNWRGKLYERGETGSVTREGGKKNISQHAVVPSIAKRKGSRGKDQSAGGEEYLGKRETRGT